MSRPCPTAPAPVGRVLTPAAARRARAAAIAAVVQEVPGVALHSSSLLTTEPGMRPEAPGIALASDRVGVSVVITRYERVEEVATRIRGAVAQVWHGPVDVHIADLEVDNEQVGPRAPDDEEMR